MSAKKKDATDSTHQIHRLKTDLVWNGIQSSPDDEQRNQEVRGKVQRKCVIQ